MKKMLLSVIPLLLLSGCAVTSTFTVDSQGQVTGTTTLSVPKSALRNVTTVEQWGQVLTDNNVPSPGATTSETPIATPSASPSASCLPGESTQTNEWTYTCSATGDLSILGDSLSSSGVGQLSFSRVGNSVTITQAPISTDGTGDNPFSIKGVTLMYTSTRITLPGTVESVSGGATKVAQDTVEFVSGESQKNTMSATVTVTGINSVATKLNLTAQPSMNAIYGVDVALTATLDSPVPGAVRFFDGDTDLGQVSLDSAGKASFIATTDINGTHNFSAKFAPIDWWNFDQSQAQQNIDIQTFKLGTKPKISGPIKVGAKLSITPAKTTPVATKATYQWLRNGVAIKGKTGTQYVVMGADFNKTLSVKVTLTKSGVLPLVVTTNPVKVRSR